MVRWNAGTEHVKTQRQTLSPAAPKIEIQKGFTHEIHDGHQERVNEAMPGPCSVVMFKYMESLHKAEVLVAFDGHHPGGWPPFRRHGSDDEYREVAISSGNQH